MKAAFAPVTPPCVTATCASRMAHATDKQKLIDVILLGLGAPGLTLIPDGLGVWYNNTLKDYEFDVAKANQILDDAGYMDADGDGVRDMPDGSRPLTFRLNWPSDSHYRPAHGRTAERNVGQDWRHTRNAGR